jgi:hypothetical protein
MSNVGTALGVGGDRMGNIVSAAVFGTKLRHALGDQIGRQLQLAVEQPADRDNRVTIDDRYRDAMGNPRPVLTYNLSDHVKDGLADTLPALPSKSTTARSRAATRSSRRGSTQRA